MEAKIMNKFPAHLNWTAPFIKAGKMSRREFVQLGLAAGLAASSATTLFSEAAKAQAKKGGLMRAAIGQGGATDSLDPATWGGNFYTTELSGCTGNMLAEVDPTNSVVPALAESFEPSDGAKTWAFKLRKGVTFHNGKTMTAKDVVATYNYHRNESSKSAQKALLSSIADIKADGDDTVIFTLTAGNADFPVNTTGYALAIFPEKDGGIDWSQGGTGAFITKKFDPGVVFEAARNPNYWNSNEPHFDEVRLLVVNDVTARTNALLSGEVEYADRIDLKTIDALKSNPDIEIDNVTGFSQLLLTLMTNTPPFDNVNVRLALKHAIDREELMQKILFGYGTVGNDVPFAPSLKYAISPEPKHSYNPGKAREYLKKAGLESLKIDLSTSEAAFAGATDAALLIQQQAKEAGIEINVVTEPADSYWDNVWMKKPAMMSYWGGRSTIDGLATLGYSAEAAWNDTFWKHPRFNELLIAARSETDEAKRAAMYAEMQQLLHDDGGQIVLMFNNYVSAHSKKVAHGPLNSNLDHDGTFMWRRWWFA
jgi:peptide/nickel transport system substrate-binding protein